MVLQGIKELFLGKATPSYEGRAIVREAVIESFSLSDVLSAFTNTNLLTDSDSFASKPLNYNLEPSSLAVVSYLASDTCDRDQAAAFLPMIQEEIIRQMPQFAEVSLDSLQTLVRQIEELDKPLAYKKFIIGDWVDTHVSLLGRKDIVLESSRPVEKPRETQVTPLSFNARHS